MNKITREETRLLLQHAIVVIKGEGQTQKKLAEIIGCEEPRITDGKNGKWTLTPSQWKVLISRFGNPIRGKGDFIKAERYESIKDFISDFKESSKQRLVKRLFDLFTRKDYQEYFATFIKIPDDELIEERLSNDNNISYRINKLEEVLQSPLLMEWYIKFKSYLILEYYSSPPSFSQELENILLIDFMNRYEIYKFMYYLCLLKYDYLSGFSLINKNNDMKIGYQPLNEFILTGDVIMEDTINSLDKPHFKEMEINSSECTGKIKLIYDLINGQSKINEIITEITKKGEIDNTPDCFNCATLKLYLNPHMKYNLLLIFHKENKNQDHPGDRVIVIPDLNCITLIQDIRELKDWLGEGVYNEDSIKRDIALVGGYVPGAMHL